VYPIAKASKERAFQLPIKYYAYSARRKPQRNNSFLSSLKSLNEKFIDLFNHDKFKFKCRKISAQLRQIRSSFREDQSLKITAYLEILGVIAHVLLQFILS